MTQSAPHYSAKQKLSFFFFFFLIESMIATHQSLVGHRKAQSNYVFPLSRALLSFEFIYIFYKWLRRCNVAKYDAVRSTPNIKCNMFSFMISVMM
ncbi:uncharacterized protein BYT42DRAFT_149685 [Radiomyces spectabilis]|uniref:uncharacterized protein n=1 Tax=Radiomyces spectabilis TaxID=64574 RepID=UPI0022202365|nr:uncharacterized protein BYT42DRAFT_149685 [Radiomyces spectabilis]KAI8366004.1 hypothetical protein BYT42DRAFT_149685 [Radiomyces spectabilis]